MRQAELLHYLILAAQREGNRRLIRGLRPVGLTPPQAEVLRILCDYAPLSLAGLGELLVCESGTSPSRLVDRLVGGGLVERVIATDDRRSVALSLTDAGHAADGVVGEVQARLHAHLDAATQGIDMCPVIEVLRLLSLGESAGNALQNRIAAMAARDAGLARRLR